MKWYAVFWALLLTRCPVIRSLRFLLVPFEGTSHVLQLTAIGDGLLQRGHAVFIARSDRGGTEPNRDHNLTSQTGIVPVTFRTDDQYSRSINVTEMLFSGTDREASIKAMSSRGGALALNLCHFMMHDELFLNEVKSLDIDLVVIDSFILAPCTVILPHHLRIPFVSTHAMSLPDACNPRIPSFVPSAPIIINKVSDQMNFKERLKNSLIYFRSRMGCMFPGCKNTTLIGEFGHVSTDGTHPSLLSWGDLTRQAELFVFFSNHMLSWPAPATPNTISLPGITYRPPAVLTGALNTVLDETAGQVVVVSFGSIIDSLPSYIINRLFESFGRAGHLTFIVKFKIADNDVISIPKNIHMFPWLPQNDILGHPRTRLFVTHCGNNGQYEALYHGVPMIGFPLFAEQHYNCFRAEYRKYATCMDIHNFTVQNLHDTIIAMTDSGNIYFANITKASAILHDAKLLPREEAAFWIEHVAKFGGKYLRPRVLDMPTYQYAMLDIVAFVSFMSLLLCFVCFKILRYAVVCFRERITRETTNKKLK